MARLRRQFFERYTPTVARDLLGCVLVRVIDGRRLSGTIVETEAYRGSRDPASHAYVGKTARNAVMFGQAGHAYVYFTYGFHHCLNVTTEPNRRPGAVLIRAIEPVDGVGRMVENRGLDSEEHVSDGPGKLTKALMIDRALNGEDLVKSERLFLERGRKARKVATSARVGIKVGTAFRWRFSVEGNRFVSGGKASLPHPQKP